MKHSSTSRKITIIIISVILGMIIGLFTGLAINFSQKEYTSASDAFTLMKINFGSKYSILSTGDLSGSDLSADNYRDTYQAIMVKDHDDFAEYLKSKGCTEYKPQLLTRYYLSTADGKKFVLKSKRASDGVLGVFPYSIELLEGITMDDIL